MIRRSGAALGVVAAAVAALVLLAPQAALAHDYIVQTDPADGQSVTSLTEIALTFNGAPIAQPGANLVEVVGPDGRYYETACPTLAGTDVTTPVTPGAAGTYQVIWRIVSSDGHPVSGQYSFQYAPPAGSAAAAGAATPVCAPAGAATPAPTEADTSGAVGGVWLGVGIGAAVTIAVAVGAWFLIRRPSSSEDDSADE
ncbi:copper resistance CopC family protein [Microbacterium sp. X-17]|uniref:copper resistance CopC family protein n=1 Tax=Microbacterium sp. X-17 TaxID=3144404 RepID=UPI0031F5CAA9